ncbi:hypothetical protein DAEQUDRAFT_195672 [Daedalea quercina L-15889]|uniref:Secreted protein n=1 Tax=Daedalea quercina L-15889 TaxID=1314783 RepID=A0A165U791_9APHY|nr:hypothetical protein DAEQUDRAFT_195672 [Daedalea quercina L-15889]
MSHAFWKCATASSSLFALYASAPSFFSASASFRTFVSSSSSSGSAISTSSSFGRSGALLDDAAGSGGGDAGLGRSGSTLLRPGGSSSEPSSRAKPCMSMPMSAPRTSIMRGSLRAFCARAGFAWIAWSCCTKAGSARCFAVRGFVASLPSRLGSPNSLPSPNASVPSPRSSAAAEELSETRVCQDGCMRTLRVLHLVQTLPESGTVIELKASLVCGDGIIVTVHSMESCTFTCVAFRPRGVNLDALEAPHIAVSG